MKQCGACHQPKDDKEFPWRSKSKGARSSRCKACHRNYSKQHYADNIDSYLSKAKRSNAERRQENKDWIVRFLQEHPCVDCKEPDIEVLQFDHIDLVGNAAKRIGAFMNYALPRLQAEVAKCQVRCANCHVRRTRRQLGWFRVPG